jgi:hypothetical protein
MNLADRTGNGAKGQEAYSDLIKAKADLDRALPRALAVATSNRDLRAAVKDFYSSASAYCSRPSQQLEFDLRAKETALQLETKAAGL